jgi:hypothetical protein
MVEFLQEAETQSIPDVKLVGVAKRKAPELSQGF